ncbi:MAG: hypothetical protein EOO16_09185 [Chitinophagaceae bacterium]|nr:MAG: hypothetical protein EOO16_09185 [Chitinophagaceae bacterium]
MSKFYQKLLLAGTLFASALGARAQVSVTATAGTTGPTAYTTLKAAFDAINANTHGGAVSISISGNTTETASASLNAGAYTSVRITATAAATISGTVAGALINLNGADNVTINGANLLTISNSSNAGQAIRFINDASNNVVRLTTIRGNFSTVVSSQPSGGVVMFDIGTTTGNDNNSIDTCDIGGNNTAVCLVYSKGTPVTPTTTNSQGFNSGNRIRGNSLHDNISATSTASVGLFLNGSNTDWTFTGNSLYHSATVNTSAQYVIRGILIVPSFTSDAHTITGNFVGGNAAGATGTMTLNASGANALGFIGIDVETGGANNLVSNNFVQNISLTYSAAAGSFGNAGIFGFIGGYNGTTAFTGNTVTNINIANNSGFVQFNGIHMNGRVTTAGATVAPTFTVTNNTVSAITGNSGGTAGDVQVHGIRLETSSSADLDNTATSTPLFTVTGNTITGVNVPFPGRSSSWIRGIGTVVTQGTNTTTAVASTAQLFPAVNVTNNNINNLSTASGTGTTAVNGQFASGVITGIHFGGSGGGSNATDIQRIRQNTLHTFTATNNNDSSSVVIGILASTGAHDISRNRIYNLTNAASAATKMPGIVGITVRSIVGGVSSVVNNMISLGNNQGSNVAIFGILQNFDATPVNALNVYYNSVVIGGAATGGSNRVTAALFRGDPTGVATVNTGVSARNNLFINTRTGTGTHVALGNLATSTALGSSNNDLYTGNANVVLWNSGLIDLATYGTNTSDATSGSFAVSFTDVNTADLHLAGASLTDGNLLALPVAGQTIDFDGQARSTTTPVKGADEVTITIGTAVSNLSEEVSTSLLAPSIVSDRTNLRIHVRRGMNIIWNISDGQGRVVKRFSQSVNAGRNDLQLSVPGLSAGTYQLTGYLSRGGKITLRFVKL